MPPPERVIAPFCVLLLHGLLLADVAMHEPDLLDFGRPATALEWGLAAWALLAYLRTVVSDPGFLRPLVSKPSTKQVSGRIIGCLVCFVPCLSCFLLGNDSTATGDEETARDVRNATELRELQPIGRSVLDSIEEADSDPGEETINIDDLEEGNSKRIFEDKSDVIDSSQMPKSSLGKVPGSPRPGKGAGAGGPLRDHGWGGRPRELEVPVVMQSGHELRWCKTCRMHQPLRTKHCRDCGRCVRTHDHHCPWVGTCVGEGNRLYFYWFLVAQFVELTTFFLVGCRSMLTDRHSRRGLLFSAASSPLLWIGLGVMALLLFMVACLLCFHTYLAMVNTTTWENISWHHISYLRGLLPDGGSPFSKTLLSNLAAYCFLPFALCGPVTTILQ